MFDINVASHDDTSWLYALAACLTLGTHASEVLHEWWLPGIETQRDSGRVSKSVGACRVDRAGADGQGEGSSGQREGSAGPGRAQMAPQRAQLSREVLRWPRRGFRIAEMVRGGAR